MKFSRTMTNNPFTDGPFHSVLQEYYKNLSQGLSKELATIQTQYKSYKCVIAQENQEILSEFQAFLDDARQFNDETRKARDLLGLKQILVTQVDNRQMSRNDAMELKQKKKMEKVRINAKLELLKKEIDQLIRDNNALREKLSDTNELPLICQLMKST